MLALLADSAAVFGKVNAPQGVAAFDSASGSNFGLILFVSNMIKILTVGAGLYVLFNVISAGLMFISASGDTAVPTKAKDQILHSVVGLAIVVFSYLIIALISFILFGKADYILSPTIVSPVAPGSTPVGT